MANKDFASILKQWDAMQKKSDNKSKGSNCDKEKKSFAEILDKWSQSHDEESLMQKRALDKVEEKTELTINQIRKMPVQDELDLHENTVEEAKLLVRKFLDNSYAKGLKKVRVITGKGLHSKGGIAILRPAIIAEIKANSHVRELFTPKANEGGSGALSVLLKEQK